MEWWWNESSVRSEFDKVNPREQITFKIKKININKTDDFFRIIVEKKYENGKISKYNLDYKYFDNLFYFINSSSSF